MGQRFTIVTLQLLSLVLFVSLAAEARASDDFPKGEIRNVRQQLYREHPELSPSELQRIATTMVRSNHLQSAIVESFMRGDFNRGFKLLEQFPGTINDLKAWNDPILLWSILQRNSDLAEALLKHSADPNISGKRGLPLFEALGQRNWPLAAQLIDAGANVLVTNNSGETPFTMLSYASDGVVTNSVALAIARQLLDRGANPLATSRRSGSESILDDLLQRSVITPYCDFLLMNCKPSHRTAQGQTALHIAVIHSDTNAVQKLLAHGFNIDQTNDIGLTPLQLAAGFSKHNDMPWGLSRSRVGVLSLPNTRTIAIGEFLLQKGATVDVGSMSGIGLTNALTALLATNRNSANWHDAISRTPLHYATMAPTAATTLILLSAGADPNTATTAPFPSFARGTTIPPGTTPLHLAATFSSPEIVSALLKAKANVAAMDAAGNTPLHLAAAQLGNNLSELLLALPPLDLTNNAGQTALHIAVENGRAEHVSELLRAGANPNINTNAYTLLHVAAERGGQNVVRVLLANNFKPDIRDINGRTPFMRAIAARQIDTAKVLKSNGADINARDKQGNTALHLVAEQDYDDAYYNEDLPGFKGLVQSALRDGGTRQTIASKLIAWKLISAPRNTYTNGSTLIWLLQHGADATATNLAGLTAMHAMCIRNQFGYRDGGTNQLAAFIKAGVALDFPNSHGITPLHLLIGNAVPSTVDWAINQVTNAAAIRDEKGRSLLLHAIDEYKHGASSQCLESIITLIKAGNMNAPDNNGRTPVHAVMQRAADDFYMEAQRLFETFFAANTDLNIADKNGNTALHYMAQNPRLLIDRLRERLYFQHWNYTARNKAGQTPLHLLASNLDAHYGGELDFFREVLQRNKASINITNAQGETLLHCVITAHQPQMAKLLVDLGADPSIKNVKGESAYVMASKLETLNYIEPYVLPPHAEYGFLNSIAQHDVLGFDSWLAAEPQLISFTNHQGFTPLLVATANRRYSRSDRTDLVTRLLEASAPLDPISALRLKRNEDFDRLFATCTNTPRGWTFEAVQNNNAHALAKLIESGAAIDEADDEGHSLLFRAARSKQPKIKRWLEEHGCKRTVFDAVLDHDQTEVAQFLSTDPSLRNRTNAQGRSLLMRATIVGDLNIVSLLLSNKARVDLQTPEGWTALHLAAATNAVEIGDKLIAAGCNITNFATGGMSPLHIAAARGSTEFVELLLRHGAPADQQSLDERYSQNTALHWAANNGYTNIVTLLLQHGADTQLRNSSDDTPEDMAKSRHSWGFALPHEVRYQHRVVTEDARRATLALLQKK